MSALLFGSISSLADTSELQREAFNRAFAAQGLDWRWDRQDYQAMLSSNGGANRVRDYAEQRGEQVDADAVHTAKSEIFRELLASSPVSARPGVVDSIAAARAAGMKVALVTTTSPDNITALLQAVPDLDADDFDVLVDATQVEAVKPDPEAYRLALSRLGEEAADCVAVEDNPGGVRSAVDAGVRCVAFPNANTAAIEFEGAAQRTDHLDPEQLAGSAA